MRFVTSIAAACLAMGLTVPAVAQEVTRNGNPGAMLLESVEARPAAKFLFIGGQAASPLDPNDRAKGYGDSKTQTISILKKMQATLERRGYAISDMIKMDIFVVVDPALGKPDYAGVNAGFKEFFGTAANPNSVVRTMVEVKGIQAPGLYVEIEGMAAR